MRDIENGILKESINYEERVQYFSNFGWDELTAGESFWAFNGTNVLIDYTLPNETDGEALQMMRELIVQGF